MTNIQQTTTDPHHIIGSTINNRYKIHSILGTGSFAIVYRAIDLLSNRQVAIKCLTKPTHVDTLSHQEKERLSAQLREINIMQSLQTHPFIVRLFDCIHSNQFIFLIMEYCEMDLYEAITQKGGFPEDVVREVFLQLVEALIHSHKLGIYHRDIKPENCLISSEYTLKLTDFGLSTTDKWSYEFGCGSVRYMAPECLAVDHDTGKGYSPALNDVWSLGIIIINMLFGKNPWHEASLSDPLYSVYITKNPDILKDQFGLTPEFNSILSMVFQRDPTKRINLHQLKEYIQHLPFFTMKQKRLVTSKSTYLSRPSRNQLPHVSGIAGQNLKFIHDQSQEHVSFEMDTARHINTSENYSIDSSTNTSTTTITSTTSSQLSSELNSSCLMDDTLCDPTTQPLLADTELFSHQVLDENTSSTSDMFYIFKYDHTQHQFSPSQHCHFSPLEPMSENLQPATDAIEKDHARQVSCVPDAHHYEEVTDGNEYAHTILSRTSSACFSDVADEEDERYMQEYRVEAGTPITPKDRMHQFTSFRPMNSSRMDSGKVVNNQGQDDKDVLVATKNDQVYFKEMPSNTVSNATLLSTPVPATRKGRKRGYLSMLIPSWV